jgi:shikimate kinase
MTNTDPTLLSTSPKVVLVGPPGSGKTSVGEVLAERWSVGFQDTDADIEDDTGRTIADIFVESGEPHFRAIERTAVTTALTRCTGVLALGGGAVLDEGTRALLRGARVVFLDVGLAEAMTRLEMNRSRPLLLGNIRAQWQALAEARRPLYEEVGDQVILTDGQPVEAIVELIDDYWRNVS